MLLPFEGLVLSSGCFCDLQWLDEGLDFGGLGFRIWGFRAQGWVFFWLGCWVLGI